MHQQSPAKSTVREESWFFHPFFETSYAHLLVDTLDFGREAAGYTLYWLPANQTISHIHTKGQCNIFNETNMPELQCKRNLEYPEHATFKQEAQNRDRNPEPQNGCHSDVIAWRLRILTKSVTQPLSMSPHANCSRGCVKLSTVVTDGLFAIFRQSKAEYFDHVFLFAGLLWSKVICSLMPITLFCVSLVQSLEFNFGTFNVHMAHATSYKRHIKFT